MQSCKWTISTRGQSAYFFAAHDTVSGAAAAAAMQTTVTRVLLRDRALTRDSALSLIS